MHATLQPLLVLLATAILAKLLTERYELNSGHGRQIIGILLFQDIAVVPLLIMIPALAVPAGDAHEANSQHCNTVDGGDRTCRPLR